MPRNDKRAAEMYALYQEGRSLAQVGMAFGCTRQSVYKMFKLRGYALKPRPAPLPFIEFNGKRYTRRNNGYYGCTNGERRLLHRDIWEAHNGPIPPGHDVHHKNGREDNSIENLELLEKAEHTRLHWRMRKEGEACG